MAEIQVYWVEFLPLMLVFMLAVISPGPDFVLILRQALLHGRRAALVSSLGVGSAMLVHVSYTILGLGLIVAQSEWLFNVVKWGSAVYLFYLGGKALASKGALAPQPSLAQSAQAERQPIWKAYTIGFTINLLNPKAMVFFLSIFSTFVSATTPMAIKFVYGAIIASSTSLWFVLISLFMTTLTSRHLFFRLSKWIDRASGLVFIGFGVRLIFQEKS